MRKTAINFGLLSGGIIIVYTFGTFLMFGEFSKLTPKDLAMVEAFGYLRYVILFLTLVFAIRHYRKQQQEQSGFKKLFMAGVYTALVIALLVGLMEFCYMLLNPDFMEHYASLNEQRLVESGASAEKLARNREMMESMKWMANPAAMGVFYFVETMILGTIMSLILAFFFRPKQQAAAIA